MKKFLPGIFIFVIVFSGTVAIQVATSSLKASAKEKSKDEIFEEKLVKVQATTINGKNIKIGETGAKITVVNFWASWCLPCMEEMPSLISFKQKYKDSELAVVSINTDENDQLKNIDKTLKKFKVTNEFLVIADKNTKLSDDLKISAIPVTALIKNKKIIKLYNGPVDFNSVEFNELVKKELKN